MNMAKYLYIINQLKKINKILKDTAEVVEDLAEQLEMNEQ